MITVKRDIEKQYSFVNGIHLVSVDIQDGDSQSLSNIIFFFLSTQDIVSEAE